jgi:cytochrome c
VKAFVPVAAVAAAIACGAAYAGDEAAARLAAERGCAICHHDKPAGPDAAAEAAPSWQEIAARYRGKPGAEERLTRRVMGGTHPTQRQWKQSGFASMPANRVELTAEEARSVVRWILAADQGKHRP